MESVVMSVERKVGIVQQIVVVGVDVGSRFERIEESDR
jgi:hypothetical protein